MAVRWLALGFAAFLAAACVFYAPHAAHETAALIPVETLCAVREGGTVRIFGEEVEGCGATWDAAMEDLLASAAGCVFLETAERIVVQEGSGLLRDALRDADLRPSAQLFVLRGEFAKELFAFVAARESGATVGEPAVPPLILEERGRYRLAR